MPTSVGASVTGLQSFNDDDWDGLLRELSWQKGHAIHARLQPQAALPLGQSPVLSLVEHQWSASLPAGKA